MDNFGIVMDFLRFDFFHYNLWMHLVVDKEETVSLF
jgi:hypothetical protein